MRCQRAQRKGHHHFREEPTGSALQRLPVEDGFPNLRPADHNRVFCASDENFEQPGRNNTVVLNFKTQIAFSQKLGAYLKVDFDLFVQLLSSTQR